ncbi:ATP-binding cassette domain-containing protein [Methanofollis formosanus]|uniref:ATP-binding cassette domain-containing protein n=1 Tax=Methanofollis formosanus TaxID=299308 RepID=A0A8G1A266_9EURY|nr:ATP-binding cassette domain-containing protein [Methanofollis formosanus]QYZ79328.1 ATP-binding cassette domain-containing protein [Methanofollis formosanus]
MAGGSINLARVYTAYEGSDLPVLRDVSTSVEPGEFVVVGGPNGAGKTTLLESINGMLPITHGTATVCGLDVLSHGYAVRRRVGYVIQNFAFDPLAPFTVGHVVMMGRYGLLGYGRQPGEEDRRAAEEALHLLGIEDLEERSIGKLSGGQQQKVLIAQNLAKKPDILLLDEPFSNLDLCTRDFISEILTGTADAGCTIVMVSHAFDALPAREIRVLVMNDGRLTFDTRCPGEEVEERVRTHSGDPHA